MRTIHGPARVLAAAVFTVTSLGVAPPLGAAPPAAVPAAPSDADGIFSAARKAWGAGAYPHYAEYATVVSFRNGEKVGRRTWETTEDLRRGIVYSRAFNREESEHPYTPHGINVGILGWNMNPAQQTDLIGHVVFAIDQDYGLAPSGRRITSVTSTSAIDAQRSALPVIGRTGTVARDYDVRLIETAADAQGTEYHLALTPLRDPEHHRLRELWIDGNSWLPEEAVVEGIGSRPPLTKVRWRVEYRQAQGATYIARETALAPLDYGKAGTLRDVTIAFDEVKLGSKLSPYRFGFSKDAPQAEP